MLPINYGRCLHRDFLDAGEIIVQEFAKGGILKVAQKMNETFFDGEPLSPKSFSSLASVSMPLLWPTHILCDETGETITIGKGVSLSALLGYIEVLPILGIALPILNAIGHLYYMISNYLSFKIAVAKVKETERTPTNVKRGACCHETGQMLKAAAAYTIHQNHLIGSLLSIIPFLKPIVRIAQGTLYHLEKYSPMRI